MLKLDLKNKRVLTVLDENSRTPLSKIAAKTGLSKQLVDYRIKNLVKDGIISGFTIQCDLAKLGYSTFGVYIRLKNLTDAKEKEIIDIIVKHPFSKWLVVCEGKWDMAFALAAKNIIEFNSQLEGIMDLLRNNIETYETNIVFSLQNFYLSILEKEDYYKMKPARIEFTSEKEDVKLDAIDIRILQELQKNSRTNLVEIASRLKSSADVVRYRIKNLVAKKIITEFRTRISFKALGYNWYQVLIDLRMFPESHEKKFLEKIKQIPNVSYIVKCMGKWDFELHMHAESNEEFRTMLIKVRDELADYLVSYDTMIIFSKHKSVALPEGVADELIKKSQ
jgi:Lrp/AsnC family transcriptional regulator for asnA, asnC and gidA